MPCPKSRGVGCTKTATEPLFHADQHSRQRCYRQVTDSPNAWPYDWGRVTELTVTDVARRLGATPSTPSFTGSAEYCDRSSLT